MVNPSTTTPVIKSSGKNQASRVSSANNTKANSNHNNNNKSGNSKTKKRISQSSQSTASAVNIATVNPLSYRIAENKNESVPPTSSPRILPSSTSSPPVTTTSQDKNLNRSGNNSTVNNIGVTVSSGSSVIDGGNDYDKRSFTKSNNKFKRSISHNVNNNHHHRNGGGNCGKWRSSSSSESSSSGKSNIKFVPIEAPSKPILSSTSIAGVLSDQDSITLLEKYGKGRYSYPLMQVSLLYINFHCSSYIIHVA